MSELNKNITLDVGCGSSKITGSIGIDHLPSKCVDIIHDLNIFPWPLPNESCGRIIFSHSISHLNDIARVIAECNRLLKPGGYIEIVAPHYSSDNFNTDPTHRMHLGFRSMYYFVENVDFGYHYVNCDVHLKLIKSSLSLRECEASWRKSLRSNPFKYFGIEWLINRHPRIYERFLCWIFPASEVYFLLQKTQTR